MKTYTKKQTQLLRAKDFTAVCNGVDTYVGAILKENALNYFQKLDFSITEQDVKLAKMIGGGNCIDRLAEVELGVFEVVIDQLNEHGEIINRRDI